jgi:PAS domain S-box-containing protein
MVKTDFRFLRANEAFCRMIGYNDEELEHLTFTDITHPDERQRDLLQGQRLLAGEIDNYNIEKRYIHKNGAIVWARVNITLVRNAENQPHFFLPIIQDITAWKKAEQNLRESESRYQRIVDTAREGIWIMNDQRRTTYVNEHMAAMLGLNPADMLDRPVEDYMFAEDLTNHEERMAARRQGKGGHYEHRFRHRDGHAIWTIVSATPIQDEEKRFAGSFAMFTNITAHKKSEEHLRAALAEKNVLLREVHHRVKNNLAAIISMLNMQRQLIKDTVGRDVLAELAARIRSMCLIHEQLYSSNDLAHIQIQRYFQDLLSHLCTSLGSTDIHFHAEAEGVVLPLDLAVPCGMIVNELVTNALKYAFPPEQTEGGRHDCAIRVTMHQQDGRYTLVVADNGAGLPDGFDWMNAPTLGMTLVRMLGRHQLGGDLTLVNDRGLWITLTFTERRGIQ